ncbi:MAG: hypothetical protein MK104_10275 [Erythrobacter sp.]|jgi:hypothetical protein|uniref:plasmid mobilization protein n=1 Tax=Qipengyuania pacifica TaxID=2860199 RepID=UPI0035C85CE3|nr:hypothetical protein [Erythrobacter sp.]
MTKTVSLRLKPHQIEEIKVAALAANLSVSSYLYRRVTDTPVLSNPELAALARLVSLAHKLETDVCCEPQLLEELHALVRELSNSPSEPGGSE